MASSSEQYQPPGADDIRSPCPALNVLANHNIIPRSGKDIPIPKLIDALTSTFHLSTDFATKLAYGVLEHSHDPASKTINLDELNKHNVVEHDASLSRGDLAVTGDNHSFNQKIFDGVMQFYEGTEYTSIQAAAKARHSRIIASKAENPDFTFGKKEATISLGESALFLSVLGDSVTGVVPVDFVKIFFQEERLPIPEGWKKPASAIELATTNRMSALLHAATPEDEQQ